MTKNINTENLHNSIIRPNTKFKKPERLFKYDNLRGFAIILVVFFHVLDSFFQFPFYRSLGQISLVIAMPLLFFISGYFSKVDENTQIKAFNGLFIPFVLFCTLWIAFSFFVFGSDLPKTPYLVPAAGLWYLITLFFMRSFLPVFTKIKHVFWIMVALALLIGLVSLKSNFLGILKGLYYLPIFMLGYYFKNSDDYLNSINVKLKNILLKLRDFIVNNKLLIIIFLGLFLLALSFIFSDFPKNFFSFEKGYVQLDLGKKIGMLMRTLTLFSSIIIVILLTYLMPNKKTFLTKIGVNSLAIYILHFYFTRSLKNFFLDSSLGQFLFTNSYLAFLYVIIVTAFIVFILSRDIVTIYMKKFIDFFVNLVVKPN